MVMLSICVLLNELPQYIFSLQATFTMAVQRAYSIPITQMGVLLYCAEYEKNKNYVEHSNSLRRTKTVRNTVAVSEE